MTAPQSQLPLQGLELAPPQVLGGVRLVPLVRPQIREDLRLSRRVYPEDLAVVSVDRRTSYIAYVPHGLVANWTHDGGAVFGSQLAPAKQKDGETWGDFITARGLRKLVQREGKSQLRFLPLHVAMEGFLALHFSGPNIAWTEYSTRAKRFGLSPHSESVVPGRAILGLDDALRLFEIHENQCGMLVFIADALASAFVVPHPDDYQALHHTLLSDFYGELLWHYGLYAVENVITPPPIRSTEIDSVDDLADQVNHLRDRWSQQSREMADGLFMRDFDQKRAYRFKPFTLSRFITDLDPAAENHIGETIYSDDGDLQYLKSYRLSSSQTRRAYLLSRLAAHNWDLAALAKTENCRTNELILRLNNAGFGYLLHQHVLDAARAQENRRGK